jgi:hypothetical protein
MANKYIFQLRRGWKWDSDPTTKEPRDDWAAYEAQENHMKPLEGELVLEYDNGVPRLKIGDGVREFSALPYMSVDSFILPKPISVTLPIDAWVPVEDDGNDNIDTYSQVVTVNNATITAHSRVDLQPTLTDLTEFYNLGVALTTANDNGIVTVYSVGVKPEKTYTIPATVTEIITEDEVEINE